MAFVVGELTAVNVAVEEGEGAAAVALEVVERALVAVARGVDGLALAVLEDPWEHQHRGEGVERSAPCSQTRSYLSCCLC